MAPGVHGSPNITPEMLPRSQVRKSRLWRTLFVQEVVLQHLQNHGVLLVVSAPSGTGKSTLLHQLMKTRDDCIFSISHTTRAKRGEERDGRDYFFVDDAQFDALIAQDAFLEWAHVHGRRYGTSRRFVEERLAAGLHVLLDIDVRGASIVKQAMADAVLVFVLPPSFTHLEHRLKRRGQDSTDSVTSRLATAKQEVMHMKNYDYVLINDEVDPCQAALSSILSAETHRLSRVQTRVSKILASFGKPR